MNLPLKNLVERFFNEIKSRPLLAALMVLGSLLIGLSQFTTATQNLVNQAKALLFTPEYRLVATVPDANLLLRWNSLTQSWQHPRRDIWFETEMRLPLSLRNTGDRVAGIEGLKLLSQGEGQSITWEAVWIAQHFEWERWASIEPQIQKQRERLTPIMLEPGQPALLEDIDFVPLDFADELAAGRYTAQLQARVTGTEGWIELLRFSFTIPEDFVLASGRVSRYQYWQRFAVEETAASTR
ncbi:hypothetical protein [endosymbiont of Lamellibrachia barhami]|uniref:hypothetical protein n=1 Tax=endosymbiont of Lamellibrachia barhami TaxID=205975 RepID=UPI0015B04C8E|nr:hypothetical protein [endosymbiont of Lamellibrachia barhami]